VGARVLDVTREPVIVSETASPPATLRFELPSPSMKAVELWFPANAAVELTGMRADAAVRPQEHPAGPGGSTTAARSATAESCAGRR
jgi:hypothetical protein